MSARQTLRVTSRSLTETCAALLACAVRFLCGTRFRASCFVRTRPRTDLPFDRRRVQPAGARNQARLDRVSLLRAARLHESTQCVSCCRRRVLPAGARNQALLDRVPLRRAARLHASTQA
ncbi:hypothetical protein PF005_g32478, partial [Phytophthora fragariae]